MQTYLSWGGLIAFLLFIGFLALRACEFSVWGLGTIVSNCPVPSEAGSIFDESESLSRELLELQAYAVRAKACPSKDTPEPFKEIDIQKAEQVFVILDTSSSMYDMNGAVPGEWLGTPEFDRLNALTDRVNDFVTGELTETYEGEFQELQLERAALGNQIGRTRSDISVKAIAKILNAPPGDVPISVFGFSGCDQPPRQLYPDAGRSVDAIFEELMFFDSTALAESIEALPDLLSGDSGRTPETGVNVVIFSDGKQSCPSNTEPADVCGAARTAKDELPYTWIHTVALSPDLRDDLACIPENAGGAFLVADSEDEIFEALAFVAEAGE